MTANVFMRWLPIIACVCLCIQTNAQDAPDAKELTALLNEFLAGASHNDAAVHDRFWANDLIYTRSAGKRVGKAEIMANVKPDPNEPETTYSAEDIRIQQYGTTAIVAFRLVGKTKKGDDAQVANFLNTGTFLKRDGKWQAVAWQATKSSAHGGRDEEGSHLRHERIRSGIARGGREETRVVNR